MVFTDGEFDVHELIVAFCTSIVLGTPCFHPVNFVTWGFGGYVATKPL
jgi:hypothetical protein